MANPAPAAAAKPSPYFVNLPVDFLFIGGASILTYLVFWQFHRVPDPVNPNTLIDGRTERIIWWGATLSWAVNWPHFSATSFRLYGNRDHLRQYPVTAIVAPLLVAAGMLGSFASPGQIAPMFLKLFLIWSPYHFSGQSIGISLLYARRGQHKVGQYERFMLSGFIYSTFLVNMIRAEASPTGYEYYGIPISPFGLPEWTTTAAVAWMYTCGALFLVLLIVDAVKTRKLPPLMYLVPGITQYVWFVLGGYTNHVGFAEFVPFFHSLQYLLIAWAMQLKEKSDREKIPGTPWYVATESLLWYGVNFAGGATLFWVLPHLTNDVGVSRDLAMAVCIAGVQIHHFFVDGVIWKLKTKSVVSPLLVNVPDMIRASEAAAPARVAA